MHLPKHYHGGYHSTLLDNANLRIVVGQYGVTPHSIEVCRLANSGITGYCILACCRKARHSQVTIGGNLIFPFLLPSGHGVVILRGQRLSSVVVFLGIDLLLERLHFHANC